MEIIINGGEKIYYDKDIFPNIDILRNSPKNVPLVIGIDPSKTGYALTVGNRYGHIFDTIELKSPREDSLIVASNLYRILIDTFSKYTIHIVGYEEVIHQDPTKRYSYNSKYKGAYSFNIQNELAEIRTATRLAFYEVTKSTNRIIPVNNNTWKQSILPEELNRKDVKKGSLPYIYNLGLPHLKTTYALTDNMSDSICIYKYLIKMYCNSVFEVNDQTLNEPISLLELGKDYNVVPTHLDFVTKAYLSSIPSFTFNRKYNLNLNASAALNLLGSDVVLMFIDLTEAIEVFGSIEDLDFVTSDKLQCLLMKGEF